MRVSFWNCLHSDAMVIKIKNSFQIDLSACLGEQYQFESLIFRSTNVGVWFWETIAFWCKPCPIGVYRAHAERNGLTHNRALKVWTKRHTAQSCGCEPWSWGQMRPTVQAKKNKMHRTREIILNGLDILGSICLTFFLYVIIDLMGKTVKDVYEKRTAVRERLRFGLWYFG